MVYHDRPVGKGGSGAFRSQFHLVNNTEDKKETL